MSKTEDPAKLTNGYYRVREVWEDEASQLGAYRLLANAKAKCDENGIELRVADRFYPSSKTCHCCSCIKKDLKLSDRIYRCTCGYIEDRDLNAARNLRDAETYEVA